MAKKILLVDDEPAYLSLVKNRLEAAEYQVLTAQDGQEALEKAKRERPDLIILDLMLPKMDGYKVCSLLKHDTRYAKIPIIFFTARAQESDEKLGLECGADAYLTKPFDPETLLTKVHELIRK